VGDAATVDDVRAGAVELRSLRDAIPSLATRELTDVELARVLHGNPVIDEHASLDRFALVDDHGELVAIAERSGSELRPKVVLRDA